MHKQIREIIASKLELCLVHSKPSKVLSGHQQKDVVQENLLRLENV